MFTVRGMATSVGGVVIKTGTPLFQALTMFHELAHAAGVVPDDTRSSDQSQKNSETIMEKCKKALNKFENK